MARVPSKVMLYGTPGSGKTTLAATFNRPLFFDVENGARFIDVPKVCPTTYNDFVEKLTLFMRSQAQERKYDTIVIDSLDWLVQLMMSDIAGNDGTTAMERHLNSKKTLNQAGGGYGGGWENLRTEITRNLLPTLDELVNNDITVVLVAHAAKKDIMDADGDLIETVTPKIDRQSKPEKSNGTYFMEWCDHILYLKDVDGKRSLVVSPNGLCVAKNRLGLSGEIELDNKFSIENLLQPKTNNAKKGE